MYVYTYTCISIQNNNTMSNFPPGAQFDKKHTAGPWTFAFMRPEEVIPNYVEPENDPDGLGWQSKTISICNRRNEILAEVKVYDTKGFVRDFYEFEPNAHLIAAAPELLEAIGEMLLSLNKSSSNWNMDSDIERAYQLCKTAFKKAKGL